MRFWPGDWPPDQALTATQVEKLLEQNRKTELMKVKLMLAHTSAQVESLRLMARSHSMTEKIAVVLGWAKETPLTWSRGVQV